MLRRGAHAAGLDALVVFQRSLAGALSLACQAAGQSVMSVSLNRMLLSIVCRQKSWIAAVGQQRPSPRGALPSETLHSSILLILQAQRPLAGPGSMRRRT